MASYKHKVIHLEMDGEHFYFGSIKALFDTFTEVQLGIKYSSLIQNKLDKPYKNFKCVIRKGELVSTPTMRGKKKADEQGAK